MCTIIPVVKIKRAIYQHVNGVKQVTVDEVPCVQCMYELTSHPGQLSLAIPSWVGAMSTSQRAVMPCGCEVKAGMVRVWVAGKTV